MFFQIVKEFLKIQWEFINKGIRNIGSSAFDSLTSDKFILFGVFVFGIAIVVGSFVTASYYVGKLAVVKLGINFQTVMETTDSKFDLYMQHGLLIILTFFIMILLAILVTMLTTALINKIQSTWRKAEYRVVKNRFREEDVVSKQIIIEDGGKKGQKLNYEFRE